MDTIDDYQRAKSTLERPKKPKAKEIFQGNIISTNNTRKMKLKDKYTRSEISVVLVYSFHSATTSVSSVRP